jgi:hypothetical protein
MQRDAAAGLAVLLLLLQRGPTGGSRQDGGGFGNCVAPGSGKLRSTAAAGQFI